MKSVLFSSAKASVALNILYYERHTHFRPTSFRIIRTFIISYIHVPPTNSNGSDYNDALFTYKIIYFLYFLM